MPPTFYTITEAAAALGIGRSTLYRHIAAGLIRSVSIGHARRIPATELDRLAAEGTR